MWRVGRQRLAWRPRPLTRWIDTGIDELTAVVMALPVALWMLNWMTAMFATCAVLPYRAIVGRWPVIAYILDPADGNRRLHRACPRRRPEATALMHQWALDIKQHGQPEMPPSPVAETVGPDSK